jgi:hypothetical protein
MPLSLSNISPFSLDKNGVSGFFFFLRHIPNGLPIQRVLVY